MSTVAESGKRKQSNEPIQSRKKCYTRYTQKYNVEWEKDYPWISRSLRDHVHFYCKCCRNNYLGGITEINRHQLTVKHKQNASSVKKQPDIAKSFKKEDSLDNKIRAAEIRIAAFITEHNLPVATVDHLVKLIKEIGKYPEVIKGLTCGRTKCTSIIKNVTGSFNKKTICDILKEKKFSIIIDESTDKGCTKHLAVVVRFRDNHITRDELLTLIPVVDCSAITMFSLIKEFFIRHNIPYKDNLIGFAADGANVMTDGKQSVSKLFKDEIPNLFVFKCICHSFALCASYACCKIPNAVENLVKNIYRYFKYSTKKLGQFKEFQHFCNLKPHKMLHPCQTRWLSLVACIKRTLEQWAALKLFFISEVSENNNKDPALEILSALKNIFNKMYLQFLDFILPYITDLNKEMQAEKPKIYTLYSRVESVYRSILEMFIKKESLELTPLESINYKNPDNLLPMEQIYFGGGVIATLTSMPDIPPAELDKFRTSCVMFYQELLDQIKSRFNLRETSLQLMGAIDPESVMNSNVSSIIPLALEFKHVINENEFNNLDKEWRILPNIHLERQKLLKSTLATNTKVDFNDFWQIVSHQENGMEQPMFPLIIKLVDHIATLPHSSANVERIFSIINLNKTKTRTRLSTSTLVGMIYTKSMIRNSNCYDFKIDQSLVKNMTTNNMYPQNKELSDTEEDKD